MRVKHSRVTIKAVRAAIKLHDTLADHARIAATAYPWWRRTDRADARAAAGRERAVADALRLLIGGGVNAPGQPRLARTKKEV